MKKFFTSLMGRRCLIVFFLVLSCGNHLFAQNYYYKGTGSLNATSSWGLNTDGTGAAPADFTTAAQIFIIQNTTSISFSGTWIVSGAGSKIVMGNPTYATPNTPTPAIAITLVAGAQLTAGGSSTFEVSVPSSGSHKIIYQNSIAISFGTINDTNLELVFDGATIATTTTRTYGNISLINGANVDMNAAAPVMKDLTIDATSTLQGPVGGSANALFIKAGGIVTINGVFRSGRLGSVSTNSLFTPNVTTTATSNGALCYADATVTQGTNLIIGSASTIEYNRGTSGQTGTQTVAALNYANLTLSNSFTGGVASNKAFATSGTINVTGTMLINLIGAATITTPTININIRPSGRLVISSASTLATGGRLTLQSDINGTASIGTLATGAAITGNVTAQLYIPAGFRKYRFLSHPLNATTALTQLTDNIDITGNPDGTTGVNGQTTGTGFTATVSNNPSAYSFNTTNANGDNTNDAGWSAFTNASTNNWAVGQGIRVLVRGTKGQAGTLDGTNASPAAVTLDYVGAVNTGNISLGLVTGGSGATAGFNFVGNPYASPVDIGAVLTAAGANVGSSFYVRNPQSGAYITVNPIPVSYILPTYSAFFVKANSVSSLSFTEANKNVCTTCPTVFRTANTNKNITLKVYQNNVQYDQLSININDNYRNGFDERNDGVKLINDALSIYTYTADKTKLAADYRNILKDSIIPIGILLPKNLGVQTYTLKVENFELNGDVQLLLYDKLLEKYTALESNATYTLTLDANNSKSIGEDRLSLVFKPKTIVPQITFPENLVVTNDGSQFTVRYKNIEQQPSSIRCLNSEGQVVKSIAAGAKEFIQENIPHTFLPAGVYIVEVLIGNNKQSKKIIK